MLSAGCVVYMKTLDWQQCTDRCAGADTGGLTASAGPVLGQSLHGTRLRQAR